MAIKRTTVGTGLPAGFPFSLAISGMPALGSGGSFKSGTFEEETAVAWHNVLAIAESSGFSKSEIAYVQCVVADINDLRDAQRLVVGRVRRCFDRPRAIHLPGGSASLRCQDRDTGRGRPRQLSCHAPTRSQAPPESALLGQKIIACWRRRHGAVRRGTARQVAITVV